jgi:hypothetical protein
MKKTRMKVTASFSIPNVQALLHLDKILMFICASDICDLRMQQLHLFTNSSLLVGWQILDITNAHKRTFLVKADLQVP